MKRIAPEEALRRVVPQPRRPRGRAALRASTALLAVICLGMGSGRAQAQSFARPRFLKQISEDTLVGPPGSQDDTEVEPHIAVDPNDPRIVVTVFQQGRFANGSAAALGYATSQDGGKTWMSGQLPGLTVAVGGSFTRGTDPVVAIGPDGAVYAQTLGVDHLDPSIGLRRSAVMVQRSDDGGLSFGAPVVVQDDTSTTAFNDKNWIAVDSFPSSPYYGRIYSVWTALTYSGPGPADSAQIVLRHSDDGGTSWSDLVPVSLDASMIGAQPVVQPDGDLTVAYSANIPCAQLSQTSHDGGEHFDPPVVVGLCNTRTPIPGIRTGVTETFTFPAAAVDAVTGQLYVVWEDSELRTDGLHAVALSSSSDGGATWTPPRAVGGSDPVHRFTPAVAARDGAVVVSFRSQAPEQDRVGMRYVTSSDAGATFGRERKLARPGKLRFAATATDNLGTDELSFLGDYMGLAISADAVHAVWCRPSRPRSGSEHHQTTWSAVIPLGTKP